MKKYASFHAIYVILITPLIVISIFMMVNNQLINVKSVYTYMQRGDLIGLDEDNNPLTESVRCFDLTCLLTNNILSIPNVKSIKFLPQSDEKYITYINADGINYLLIFHTILLSICGFTLIIQTIYICHYYYKHCTVQNTQQYAS